VPGGWRAAGRARPVSARSYLSIGDVLSLLREEFPDVTISKIRFLESQGLVDPERSPSGYRKFYDHDVERLRWVLRQQRDQFLPLKVIRDRLSAAGDGVPSEDVYAPSDSAPGTAIGDEPWSGANGGGPAAAVETVTATARTAAGSGAATGGAATGGAVTGGAQAGAGAEWRLPAAAGNVVQLEAEHRQQAAGHPSIGATLGAVATTGGDQEVPDRSERRELPLATPGRDTGAGNRVEAERAGRRGPDAGDDLFVELAGRLAGEAIATPPQGARTEGRPATGPPAGRPSAAAPSTAASGAGSRSPAPAGTSSAAAGSAAARPPSTGRAAPAGEARPAPAGARAATHVAASANADVLSASVSGVSLTLAELCAATGLTPHDVAALEGLGLLAPMAIAGDVFYDEEALTVAKLAVEFGRFGIEPRHLRLYRNAVDREVSLVEQVITPLLRQRNPESRQRAMDAAAELARLGQGLRASLVRTELRRQFGN
jgi:DNA-binding transcriptional MerR regulator